MVSRLHRGDLYATSQLDNQRDEALHKHREQVPQSTQDQRETRSHEPRGKTRPWSAHVSRLVRDYNGGAEGAHYGDAVKTWLMGATDPTAR